VEGLWEKAFSRENLMRALKRVERKKGAPGVDGMTTAELRPWLHQHRPEVRKALDEDTYRPSPVRRVLIPKPDGGERELGVPTVLDRLIQLAATQAMGPIFDLRFSEHSYGYRPGRSAQQAVKAAQGYVAEGLVEVVDVDLERFFDRVQHDVLMDRVARVIGDRRLLRLIRRYLEAGVMVSGVKQATEEGTPQGSPLSPLLSNIMLDDLDRELERRGHRFIRYADDLRIYVRSERAGERVLAGVTEFIEKRLKLKVNRKKSSVRHASRAVVLGFGYFFGRNGKVGIRVAEKSRERLLQDLRKLTGRNWRIAMPERIERLNKRLGGWAGYFARLVPLSELEKIDGWLRRRLRQVRWKEWKRPRARVRNLRKLGIPEREAHEWGWSGTGSWRMAGSAPLARALPNRYWDGQGLIGLAARWHRLRRA
jgi:group II intron reverse transcriptase/maturase